MELDTRELPSLKHYSDNPLVTVQLVTHSGDLHLVPRAIESLCHQTIPHELMDVQLIFDGKPTPEEDEAIVEATAGVDFPILLIHAEEKSGYYTKPRNQALPKVWGTYIVHMDADNRFAAAHLQNLLNGIRDPEGWHHFAYGQRVYVSDEGAPKGLPGGTSPFKEWTPENVEPMVTDPMMNFIDTGDFIIGRSTLYWLAELTGHVWDGEMRRFGDWELISRMARVGFRGKAIHSATHFYHWTGQNLQLTRGTTGDDEVMIIPQSLHDQLVREGKYRAN